jgi:predicted transcriptional regulator of viral defense system
MESSLSQSNQRLSALDIQNILRSKKISVFNRVGFQRVFGITNINTAYTMLRRLVASKVIQRVSHGVYVLNGYPVDDLVLAATIYQPSYISLESALSYYGVLSQIPFAVTSITARKSLTKQVGQRSFIYAHIQPALYWGFVKDHQLVIAEPEKALLDTLYLCAKGLRNLHLEELDLSRIKKKLFDEYVDHAHIPQLTAFIDQHRGELW